MIYLFLAVLTGIGLFFSNMVGAASLSYDAIFKKYGSMYGVDWRLLKALAIIESSLNEKAINANDPSYGLMQILCSPDSSGRCTNKFFIDGWGQATKNKLLDADFNIWMGVQIIGYNIKTYGFEKAIAIYNAYDQRHASKPFKNQAYVNKVLKKYNELKNETP